MRIEVDCATAKVVEATPAERDWLRGYLTFNDPRARFTNGNPVIDLLDPMTDTFPAGFAIKAWRAGATRTHLSGRLDPITIELVDVRASPPERRDIPLEWLRDYQRKAVETALARTRGIIQMPTGAGKSVTAAGIIASVPDKWLVLVPQADLLEQFAAHFRQRLGEEPGIIGDGIWNPQRVTIATFQTLSRRMSKAKDHAAYELVRSVRGLIVDEVHQAASGTFNFVLSKAINAYYRIGFSATPLDRSDKKSIFVIAQLGGIIHRTTSAELRALGMLADARIKMVRVEQGSTAPTWPGVYGECVVKSKPRNAVVVHMAAAAQKPALVFVSQVRQGNALLPLIQKAGMRAELVWGEDDTDQRRKALKDLVEGRLDVIVCSSVFQQAVDIPSLASVVNGAGGSSVIQTLQRIGRGTRVTKDKTTFEVWDVLDDGHRWLRKHGAQRKDVYESEGYRVEVLDSIGAAPVVDTRKDEHGFVMGSAAQAAHRAAVRREALQQLTGLDTLKNPRRGKILRPHQVVGYACTVCGAPNDCLPPECPGYMPDEAQGKLL